MWWLGTAVYVDLTTILLYNTITGEWFKLFHNLKLLLFNNRLVCGVQGGFFIFGTLKQINKPPYTAV